MVKLNKKVFSIIIAVLFSFILWGSVTLSNSYYTTIKVPLRMTNLPKGYAVSSMSITDVNIRIKGDGWRLASLILSNNLEYYVSAGLDSQAKNINLRGALGENAWLSSGIQLFDIYPDILSVRMERITERKIKISPDLGLNFKQDFGLVSGIKVIPDSVTVYGPKSLVNSLRTIPTVKRNFSNLDDRVLERIELLPIRGLTYSLNSCAVRFEVQKIVDKTFENLEVEVRNTPRGEDLLVFPNSITIVLRGGINILGRLKNEDLHPFVDYNQVIKDTLGIIEPEVNVPDYISIIDKKPNQLQYIIKKY
ncbi:MAG: YbbR-like domain-containing protein [Ignavibacteria bacterium]|jgi:YbbR domain-containing protein|nr:YbbR-like domain-containing protein [Ignavibacteria bacterium]MCU7504073.1 YbbR-like domain-containing protein [Ignavibacteria bacterium]MCU7518258.1 YbbR-like domain-containing protein [Ignavibacteria bacterium]